MDDVGGERILYYGKAIVALFGVVAVVVTCATMQVN